MRTTTTKFRWLGEGRQKRIGHKDVDRCMQLGVPGYDEWRIGKDVEVGRSMENNNKSLGVFPKANQLIEAKRAWEKRAFPVDGEAARMEKVHPADEATIPSPPQRIFMMSNHDCHHWLLVPAIILTSATVINAIIVSHVTPNPRYSAASMSTEPPKPPAKLLQGCSQELLHLQGFRQFTLMCRLQPPLAVVAYEGMLDAMQHCRDEMRFQPWDCSQPGTILHEPTLLRYGYRESAYLLAMSSAGAAWGVATACAQGWLEECRCVQTKDPKAADEWEWGGCSYGVQFGIAASRKMLTRTGPTRSPLRRIEKHNLKAGRLAVKKTLISSCKCHGVSGSCQQKTCWKKTSDMKAIAQHLTEKYKRAKRVYSDDMKMKNAELIYLEPTPDSCAPQLEYQLQQRRSLPRICNWRNETHSEGDCGLLCCGRGYKIFASSFRS
uniref:Protein Wnt n=1 Tax=Panagrellus redivivus TaxID=6233 RepID=A0A7E4UXM4_PANRE